MAFKLFSMLVAASLDSVTSIQVQSDYVSGCNKGGWGGVQRGTVQVQKSSAADKKKQEKKERRRIFRRMVDEAVAFGELEEKRRQAVRKAFWKSFNSRSAANEADYEKKKASWKNANRAYLRKHVEMYKFDKTLYWKTWEERFTMKDAVDSDDMFDSDDRI